MSCCTSTTRSSILGTIKKNYIFDAVIVLHTKRVKQKVVAKKQRARKRTKKILPRFLIRGSIHSRAFIAAGFMAVRTNMQ